MRHIDYWNPARASRKAVIFSKCISRRTSMLIHDACALITKTRIASPLRLSRTLGNQFQGIITQNQNSCPGVPAACSTPEEGTTEKRRNLLWLMIIVSNPETPNTKRTEQKKLSLPYYARRRPRPHEQLQRSHSLTTHRASTYMLRQSSPIAFVDGEANKLLELPPLGTRSASTPNALISRCWQREHAAVGMWSLFWGELG